MLIPAPPWDGDFCFLRQIADKGKEINIAFNWTVISIQYAKTMIPHKEQVYGYSAGSISDFLRKLTATCCLLYAQRNQPSSRFHLHSTTIREGRTITQTASFECGRVHRCSTKPSLYGAVPDGTCRIQLPEIYTSSGVKETGWISDIILSVIE